ncbi:MAG: hypothetical protein SH850_07970 [Planctomycetaceae bacterium]|nr:hypothetical protein [Planctomycetaceae bacterium]
MVQQFETATTIARQHNIAPRIISDLFYSRHLNDAECPIVNGRRIIPREYVGEVERVLRDRGIIGKREAIPC